MERDAVAFVRLRGGAAMTSASETTAESAATDHSCCAPLDGDGAVCCAPLDAVDLQPAEAEATAALFKALGDPARVRLVNLLATEGAPICVCDLTAPLGLSQPTVSHHLKKLAAAGLVER